MTDLLLNLVVVFEACRIKGTTPSGCRGSKIYWVDTRPFIMRSCCYCMVCNGL